jgi:hypothetical protein
MCAQCMTSGEGMGKRRRDSATYVQSRMRRDVITALSVTIVLGSSPRWKELSNMRYTGSCLSGISYVLFPSIADRNFIISSLSKLYSAKRWNGIRRDEVKRGEVKRGEVR